MASLDDIYDSIDVLDKAGAEYLLITIQKGKKEGKADVFYNLKNDDSLKVLTKGLKIFSQEIDKRKSDGEFN
jgi:hypothetical protein